DLYIIVFSFLTAFTASITYTLHCYYGVTDFTEQTGNFSGVVADYEVYDGDRASYTIKGRINGVKKAKINLYTNELGADYGDTITLTDCTFKEFESDYLFDTKTWYKSRHIFLCVYKAEDIEITHNNSALVKKSLVLFRENTIKDMCRLIGSETGGFLAGMIFGEKQYLDNNTKTSLYRIGIGHIFAVSGLHVSIIASIAMFIMQKLRVNKFVSFGMINLLFLFIVIITDYPISAVRAVLMLDIMYSAPLFRRQNDSLNSIAVAVVIISVTDPYIIYNSGFILSVCGTFGIAVFGKLMAEGIENRLAFAFITALCTSLVVMPASMYYFDETSVVSPFSNIIIVPFCIFAMILGLIYIISGGLFKLALYIS
ncbi:MAG: ComEC/Rec2 family competence protein, partial [Ruminococcus sp.]|nr:ComEC/Rec2 family competence protein [Ruminococcus sp.]